MTKNNKKISWSLIVHLVNFILIIILLIGFWINYNWLQKFQISFTNQKLLDNPATNSANYDQIFKKIDDRQKLELPKAEDIKNLMPLIIAPSTVPPASENINSPSPIKK